MPLETWAAFALAEAERGTALEQAVEATLKAGARTTDLSSENQVDF
mgnify:CR=1 FL=1